MVRTGRSMLDTLVFILSICSFKSIGLLTTIRFPPLSLIPLFDLDMFDSNI